MFYKIKICLIAAHVFILCISNVLVQYPFNVLGLNTTWGAFSYPLIFIFTDLTTRMVGALEARRIVYLAMLPGLISSYLISNVFESGTIWVFNMLALRIAFASFTAYLLGQLSDIFLFQKLRKSRSWWLAPGVGNALGCVMDTYSFFFIAFFFSSNLFLANHWLEIASVDLAVKLVVSLASVLPLYRLALNHLQANTDYRPVIVQN